LELGVVERRREEQRVEAGSSATHLAVRQVESFCIDDVVDADIDIRQLGDGFATTLEVTAKEHSP
jgi:hypothetical protein